MKPEFHRPVAVERISDRGWSTLIEASPAECQVLARRMGVPALHALDCRFRLESRAAGAIEAEGMLRARMLRTCVLTLEDFETVLEEAFRVRFVPAGRESAEIDPEADDEIPYMGGTVDLGEAAAEQLALALEPYPRKPGAELPAPAPDPEEIPPFGALAGRKAPDRRH